MPWRGSAKIAFIGSHSVRKSNAVHAFASAIGRAGLSVEVGREVALDLGYGRKLVGRLLVRERGLELLLPLRVRRQRGSWNAAN